MDFIFAASEKVDKNNLVQGDLLIRNEGLRAALCGAHAYYAEALDYTHFLVLTQSCDLVLRGKKPKTRYITLAAVRPLSILVERLLAKISCNYDFPILLCQKDQEVRARQLLERLLHNTEEGYFFIRKGSHPGVAEDLCVFLALSVALRVDHYQACLNAKVAQLDEIFSAKVGWLTGNMYSRVATPDLEERMPAVANSLKDEFFRETLFDRTGWLDARQLKDLKKLVAQWQKANPGIQLSRSDAEAILRDVPTTHETVVKRVIELLGKSDFIKDADRSKNLLLSDQFLQKLLAD